MVSAYWIGRVSLKLTRVVFRTIEVTAGFFRKACTRGLISMVFWRRRKERSLVDKTVSVQKSVYKPSKYVTSSGKEITIEVAS